MKNQPIDSDLLKKAEEFFSSGSDPDIFHLPEELVLPYLESPSEKSAFSALIQLETTEFKVLIFKSLGHDPGLIAESLGHTGTGKYWSLLDSARKNFRQKAGQEPNDDILKKLKTSLDQLLEFYIVQSETLDQETDRSKKKRSLIKGLIITVFVLLGTYIFLWNLILPPNGPELYSKHLHTSISLLESVSDSATFLFEVKELTQSDQWNEALALLEEELNLSADISEEAQMIQIGLLIRGGHFSQARSLLRAFKTQNPATYQSDFKNLRWKIRFLR